MKFGKIVLNPVPVLIGRKECNGNAFILQKLNYIHNNPFVGKWQLSINTIEYPDSSAKFYICGEQRKYPVMNFRELDDIDLNSNFKE